MTQAEDRTRNTDRPAETAERRRKNLDTTTDPTLRRFGIGEDFLDRKQFAYRSVADDGGIRLMQLTEQDDYDFVTAKGEKADKATAPGVVKYQSGLKVDGSPQYTYLLRKKLEFAVQDRTAKDAKVVEAEKARSTPEDAPEKSYTPKR